MGQNNQGGVGPTLFLILAAALLAPLSGFAQNDSPQPSPAPTPTPATDPTPATVPPAAPSQDPNAAKPDPVQDSVVKVFSVERSPNPYQPWSKGAPTDVTGSGVVIEGHRIITNAHVVLYGSQFQIQASQAGDKLSATVEAIAPGIDLAILKLDDDKFFDTHPPLPRATLLPQIKDPVTVYGYPKGGDTLSITKGIVSRIEFTAYHYFTFGLRIQIDAAINPGNSGGAAVVDGKMVGMAFSHLTDSENIGYIIPTEEIELFLQSIADGRYRGKAAMFDSFQTLENPALRAFLKLDPSVHGMVVTRPFDSDPASPLKPWDVITKIGDTPVDDQGMVQLRDDLHVKFQYLVQKTVKDGRIPLTVVRGGNTLAVELPALTERPLVIPYLEGSYPSYFIFGPLVFANVTGEYVGDWLKSTSAAAGLNGLSEKGSPLVTRMNDKPAFDGERLVIVSSPFFPDKISEGYSNPVTQVVKSIDGVPIRNLAHLVQILRDSKDEFVTVEFYDHYSESCVFRRADLLSSTDDILTNSGIRSQGSPDMMSVWNAKPGP